jgi:hypothetical protein
MFIKILEYGEDLQKLNEHEHARRFTEHIKELYGVLKDTFGGRIPVNELLEVPMDSGLFPEMRNPRMEFMFDGIGALATIRNIQEFIQLSKYGSCMALPYHLRIVIPKSNLVIGVGYFGKPLFETGLVRIKAITPYMRVSPSIEMLTKTHKAVKEAKSNYNRFIEDLKKRNYKLETTPLIEINK